MEKEKINGIVYISGKMRGLKKSTYEAHFRKATNELIIQHGVHPSMVVNPCYIGRALQGLSDEAILKLDLMILANCDAIYLLNNWEDSHGANEEKKRAEELGLAVYYEPKDEPVEPRRKKR
jgi:hypothetical protein